MLTVEALANVGDFSYAKSSEETQFSDVSQKRSVESVYCCDLLSVAMGKAPSGSAWITVIGNINAVAVASLADVACVIVADGADADPRAVAKATAEGIPILTSKAPIFETAVIVSEAIRAQKNS